MAWCHQATSHYLSQCWPRSLSPYGVTRPQWVNSVMWEYSNLFTKSVKHSLEWDGIKPCWFPWSLTYILACCLFGNTFTSARTTDQWWAEHDVIHIIIYWINCVRKNHLPWAAMFETPSICELTETKATIGSGNGLSLVQHQAISWTNAGIEPLWGNSSEIWVNMQQYSYKKINFKMLSAKCQPLHLRLEVLTHSPLMMSSSAILPAACSMINR